MATEDWIRRLPIPVDIQSIDERYRLFTASALAPSFLYLLLLVGLPLLFIVYISLHEASLLTTGRWVGVDNYVQLFQQSSFWEAFEFGMLFAVGSTALQLVVGLLLALLINQQFKGVFAARVTALFPYLVPTVIVATIWQWLLSPSYGLINGLATSWGILDSPISFFGQPDYVLPSLVVANSWRFTSFAVIIILARLQAIDQTLYEQAKVDGASTFQQFWTITLPNLRSAIFLVVLLRTIFMFNHFDIIWILTRGGPFGESTNIPVFIFREAFLRGNLAIGSTAAVSLFVILLLFSIIYFRIFQPSREVETRA